ncbi:MAG: STING domain-containing protein [Kovacikia sp.]
MDSQNNILNVDELLAQATCAILTKKNGEYNAIASAWLLSEQGHLVTAGHTFKSQETKIGGNVWVQFLDQPPIEAILEKMSYESDKGIDFAILKLIDSPINRVPLRSMLIRDLNGEFILRGYGTSLPNQQSIGQGLILGTARRGKSSENRIFQLRSQELAYEGFSGGAVYSNQFDAVVAIQTEAKMGSQTILAMPLFRVVDYWKEIEGFASLPGTCFVIAPKDRLDKLANEVVRPVMAEELKYEVKTSEPEQIGDNDLSNIEQAELIVADVTGNDPNVIYELAVGHGMGTPDIILGEENADHSAMPFNVTEIKLDDVESAKKILRKKIKAIKAIEDTIAKSKSTPTNLVAKSLRAPLTEISPAYGLALGHFYNFVKQVGDALLDAVTNPSIKIIVNDEEITDEQREKVLLSIVIPKRLQWADHQFINREVKKLAVSASVSLPDRPRPFTLWALKNSEGGFIQLVDIFPTAMGVITKAIDQRLQTSSGQRSRTPWRELEDKEIARFSSSLSILIQSESGLARVVKVKSWKTVFPQLPDTP